MLTVEHYIKSFAKECVISVRLYGRLPPGGLDYRPTAGQRSTLELLRYLSYGPYNGVRRILAGDWTQGRPASEVTRDMPPSDFPGRMAWQAEEVARLVRSASPVDLLETDFIFPWGETLKKGEALVAHPLKWLTAYRMQLFLYLKGAGVQDVGTPDIWHGKDARHG
jgi:hypothetical protein